MKVKPLFIFLFAIFLLILNSFLKIISTKYLLLIYLVLFLIFIIFKINYIIGNIGVLLFNIGKEDKGLKYLKYAVNKNINLAIVYLYYGVYLLKNGKSKESLEILLKGKEKNPPILIDKNIMLSLGSCYWQNGDIDKGISILEELKAKYEFVNENVLTTIGYLYYLKGNLDLALENTTKSIEINPNYASAYDNLGQIYFKQNEIEKAIEAFEKAISFKELVDSYYNLGLIYENKGDKQKAIEFFEKAKTCQITSLNTVTLDDINKKLKSLS